jgi:hypothetical protein
MKHMKPERSFLFFEQKTSYVFIFAHKPGILALNDNKGSLLKNLHRASLLMRFFSVQFYFLVRVW